MLNTSRMAMIWYSLRHVSTWSPLASAFNAKPHGKTRFNAQGYNVGLFGIPQLKDPTGFYLLQSGAETDADGLVREATGSGRTRKVVQVFDELSDCLCRVADMADFVRVAHPDKKYAHAAQDACMAVSGLVEKLNTNTAIHHSLHEILAEGDTFPMDAVDKRVAELFMFDFEQSGIHLEETTRNKFVELNENILSLSTFFMQGSQKPVFVPREMLPPSISQWFSGNGTSITMNGLNADHPSDVVREASFRCYLYQDPHQEKLLESLLDQRDQLAKLVEFSSFAERSLRGTLAESPENTLDFLDTLSDRLRPRAESDFTDIKQLKESYGIGGEVMPWDPPYYSGLARHERCNVDSADMAPYFSLGSCMEGLQIVFQSLYGVKLEHQKPEVGEVWSPEVHKLAVIDEAEGTLGHIYCDFFERNGKPHQDSHFTIRGGKQMEDGTYQTPIVVLMLNFPVPNGSLPSLLSTGQMENLFHEFGHAMHSMLGRTRYQHVTGTRCSTDFAEVPSILMEYFASDPRVLSTFARHYQTGDPLSQDKIMSLCRAKRMFAASDMQQQVYYSVLDQVYHGKHPLPKSTGELSIDLQKQYYSIPPVPNTAWQLRFSHFVGYGARYYAYLMSRAVASRIWHQCFKADPFSRSMGEKYRREVLAHGGGKPPSQLIEAMLGEPPMTSKLVQSLMDDLDDR